MAGDERTFFDPDQTSESEPNREYDPAPESPASVVFMEMMRQAAAKREADIEAEARAAQPVALNQSRLYEDNEERDRAAALERERLKRLQRKQENRRRQTVGMVAGFLRSLIIVGIAAATMATILSVWTKPETWDRNVRQQLAQANATPVRVIIPTATAIPNIERRIGIISGHYGKPPAHFLTQFDPGAICEENGQVLLTENEINFAIASQVVAKLRERGYSVDLLEEFDPRLQNYDADLILSLHSNDCSDYGERVSGFLVSQSQARPQGGADEKLVNCVARHYREITGLDQRFGLTRDMTDYHVFTDIRPTTPGAILELGFMRDDQELLTMQQPLLAEAVVQGILCFLDPNTGVMGPTPIPSETPPPPDATPVSTG